jgi:hypothetical protein
VRWNALSGPSHRQVERVVPNALSGPVIGLGTSRSTFVISAMVQSLNARQLNYRIADLFRTQIALAEASAIMIFCR